MASVTTPAHSRPPARARRRRVHRARLDDRRGGVRGVRSGRARRGHRPARGSRGGGGRGLLQRDLVGAARRDVPLCRRHLPVRPRGPGRLVGLPRRLGLHGRQDGELRGDGVDLRGVRRARGLAAGGRGGGRRGAGARQLRRRDQDRSAHPGPRLARPRHPRGRLRRVLLGRVLLRPVGLGHSRPRRLRRAPVGRPAVLRLRRLRPDRDSGGGGARARAGDPAGDRDGPGRRRRGVRRGGGRRPVGARVVGHGGVERAGRGRRDARWPDRGRWGSSGSARPWRRPVRSSR